VEETHRRPDESTYRYREQNVRPAAMCSAVDGHRQSQTNRTGHNSHPVSDPGWLYDVGAQSVDKTEDTKWSRDLDRKRYPGVSPTDSRLTKVHEC